MYCITLQIYKREHIQNLPEPFCNVFEVFRGSIFKGHEDIVVNN